MNRYSPYYDPDENRVSMSIDKNGSWVHIKTAEALRADADKEWGASATERARLEAEIERLRERLQFDPGGSDRIDELEDAANHLRTEIERLTKQGQADQRALHDALRWAHEWHGKDLPPPSRAVVKALEALPKVEAEASGLEQEETGTLPNGNKYRVRSYSSYETLTVGCDCGPDNICLRCENYSLRLRAQDAQANLRFVEEREMRTVEALTAACLERDEVRAALVELNAATNDPACFCRTRTICPPCDRVILAREKVNAALKGRP